MSWDDEARKASYLRKKMMPEEPIKGKRGYYPVCSKEEWDQLPDLYKVVTWFPYSRIYNERTKGIEESRPRSVIFNTKYEHYDGCSCDIMVPIESAVKIHMCLHRSDSIFSGASLTGVQFENGVSYAAERMQDSRTGSMIIYCFGKRLAMQGGCMGYIPEGVTYEEEKGAWLFDEQSAPKGITFAKGYKSPVKKQPSPHTKKYMARTKEEFQEINPLYRLVSWPALHRETEKADYVKGIIFDAVEKTHGIPCIIKTHRENAMKILSCEMPGSIFSGAKFSGVITEKGCVLPAELERDEYSGCFAIVTEDGICGLQGGYHNHFPEGVFYDSSGELNIQNVFSNPHKSSIITHQGLNPYDSGWGLWQDIRKSSEKEKKQKKPRTR